MDLVEQIEKAFKAGFNCAMDNVEIDSYDCSPIEAHIVDIAPGFSLDKATYDYINKTVPYPQAQLSPKLLDCTDLDISNKLFGV